VNTSTSRYFSDNDSTIFYCSHHFRVMFPDHIKSMYSKEQIVAQYLDANLPQHKFVHDQYFMNADYRPDHLFIEQRDNGGRK